MRVEQIEDCTLYHADCMDVLPTMDNVDACVIDPPYGVGEAKGKNKSRGKLAIARDYGVDCWDDETKDDAVLLSIKKAKWAVVFGGNYYALPPTSCWLVWDKQNGTNDFADCELAWTNLNKAVRRIVYRWNVMLRKNNEPRGDHPTQKPVGVMKWVISQIPEPNKTIFDSFMGSGTTGVACVNLRRKFIGIEKEEKYFDIACKRIEVAYKTRPKLFEYAEKKKKEQMRLI